MFDEPKQLAPGAAIDKFIPDPNLSWVAAYAGPCGDPACKDSHVRLYMVPIIGWLQIVVPIDEDDEVELVLRPAIMTPHGAINDYLDTPPGFNLLAVLRDTQDTVAVARAVFHEKFGDNKEILSEVSTQTLPN